MPTVSLERDQLFHLLEQTYTDDEFAQLCFDFGIELDDVTSEKEEVSKERGEAAAAGASDTVLYKIDIPANRYDLLCLEGIGGALRVFLGKDPPPVYSVAPPTLEMIVKPEVKDVREFVVAAVLRGITFTPESFARFIDLQTKLHKNICRERTLVSIGTHDLSTIKAPFSYEARAPKDIRFVALDQTKETDANELFAMLVEQNSSVKPYLPIIEGKPAYPVIYDSEGHVLSLPPIINSEHSKLRMSTHDVLIEVTAIDNTKANIVLNTICAMFSRYCSTPFTSEQVTVKYPDGTAVVTPDLSSYKSECTIKYINEVLDLKLSGEEIMSYLKKMMLYPAQVSADGSTIEVDVPVTRSDILHACDIMEDVAIAYGYNNLNIVPPSTLCVGSRQPLNKFTDQLRQEMAQYGFWEIVTLSLCSKAECYSKLRKKEDGAAVCLGNSAQYEIARTSLLPGLLKNLFYNKSAPVPIKIFEVSDVVLQCNTTDVGARNKRVLTALCASLSGGFEVVHGLMDRLMVSLGVDPALYRIKESDDETYFPGRRADVLVNEKKVGVFGFLHPEVIQAFKVDLPVAALELDVEPFL